MLRRRLAEPALIRTEETTLVAKAEQVGHIRERKIGPFNVGLR